MQRSENSSAKTKKRNKEDVPFVHSFTRPSISSLLLSLTSSFAQKPKRQRRIDQSKGHQPKRRRVVGRDRAREGLRIITFTIIQAGNHGLGRIGAIDANQSAKISSFPKGGIGFPKLTPPTTLPSYITCGLCGSSDRKCWFWYPKK